MRLLPALVTLLLLAACSSGPGAGQPPVPAPPATTAPEPAPTVEAAVPVLTWRDCEDNFECATLPVALGDTGRTLDLAVTRLPASGERIGALVVNPGGPGASAVDYLQAAHTQLPDPLGARFDLVAFDPRGVGRSEPVECLDTDGLAAYLALDPSPDDAAELAGVVDGNRAFADGCGERSGDLLEHVSTTDVVSDLELLRRALGEEQLTYLGYSYGTAIGAAYLQAHPDRVRAAVLDGALDPTLSWDRLLEGQSRGFDVALEAFLADCERVTCAFRQAVEGDLGAAYDALDARVDARPLEVGEGRTLGPGELSLGVGAALYDREQGWPALAQGLADAEDGDGRVVQALADSYADRSADGYGPLLESNLAVNCVDRPWPADTASYTALADRVAAQSPRFGEGIVLSGLACAAWPAAATGRPAPVTAAGAPPVVVIGTSRDPATPYAWSVALADQLESGVLVSVDGDGHTAYRSGAPDCVLEPVTDYLLTGRVAGPVDC